MVQYLRS